MPVKLIDPRTAKAMWSARGYQPANLPDIQRRGLRSFGAHKPADTFIPVDALAEPGYLIETDAIAVVD
jgi:enamine deaminase RidA (YjgF/YER057c/UK114 family)